MESDKNNSLSISTPDTKAFSADLRHSSATGTTDMITKKAQKLSSALYLITGFFSDSEPLKWKLRNAAISLATAQLSLTLVEDIINLLSLARHASLVSEGNHSLIAAEFVKFKEMIGQGSDLSSEFFTVAPSPRIEAKKEVSFTPSAPESVSPIKDTSRPVVETTSELLPSIELVRTQMPASVVMDNRITESVLAGSVRQPTEDSQQQRASKPLKDYGVVAVKKNSRQSVIIGLLKRKKEVMIKDITPLIEGCSEKTVQRELLAMVDAGILHKIGEKRWSRYTLAAEV